MRFAAVLIVGCAMLAICTPARAGLYHPAALGAFDVDENGNAVALNLDAFLSILGDLKQEGWRPGSLISPNPPERYLQLKKVIDERHAKGIERLSETEKLALCADLLRLRADPSALNQAVNILSKIISSRPRVNGFLAYALYAHALKTLGSRGQIRDAQAAATEALAYPVPENFAGLTAKQIAWYKHFEKSYHLPFLAHRARLDEETGRAESVEGPARPKLPTQIDPLFRDKVTNDPVRYVNEAGEYQPGGIAPAEQAKLPPDAIAVVQQLLLWYPSDPALIWQLAELYNAKGDLKSAELLFNQCISEYHIDSREARDHRSQVNSQNEWIRAEVIRMAEEKKKAEEDAKRRDAEAKAQREMWIKVIVAAVLVVIVYWQAREMLRRIRRWSKQGIRKQ